MAELRKLNVRARQTSAARRRSIRSASRPAPSRWKTERAARSSSLLESRPLTLEISKEAFYAQIELGEQQAYELTKAVMATNSLTCDTQEGMCAFLDKRAPTWTGE